MVTDAHDGSRLRVPAGVVLATGRGEEERGCAMCRLHITAGAPFPSPPAPYGATDGDVEDEEGRQTGRVTS